MSKARQAILVAAAVAIAGCAAMSNEPAEVMLQEPRVTCAQATRAARDALRKLGYTVENVVPARGSEPGRVEAVRHSGWTPADPSPGKKYRAGAVIDCDDAGATVTATAEGEAMDRMRFAGRFGEAFRDALAADRPAAAARDARASAARDVPQRGLSVSVVPLAHGDAPAFADVDPLAAGVVPVRVEIDNRTDRRVAFDPDDVRLTTVEGERRSRLSAGALRERFGADVVAVRVLQDAALVAGEIGPGERRRGFLYFEAAGYRRATVVVTDVESGEAEGFSIRF